MNKMKDVANIMSSLQYLASTYSCAIVCVRHLNKGQDKAQYRGMGSIGITGAARSEMHFCQHHEDKQKRVLFHTKNNCGALGPSLIFGFENGQLKCQGETALKIEDLLAESRLAPTHKSPQLSEAIEFLRQALKNGPALASETFKDAEELGISQRTIKRAKEELGIKTQKTKNGWLWLFPDGEGGQECQQLNHGPLGPLGTETSQHGGGN